MPEDRLVILGNGGAAVSAAAAARRCGHRGEIHLVSDTEGPAFNPMLSPYFLKGKIPWERCFPFGANFYRDHDITCHFGAPVESLDAVNQRIFTAAGRTLTYDRCLLATGAAPFVPPVPGLRESKRALPLRTAASTRKLAETIRTVRKAVVLGASLVGMKMAEILVKTGVAVILLDVVDQVLPRGTHPAAAAVLRAYLEKQGVDVRLGCTLEGMEGANEEVVCHFSSDVIETADIVVVCTGVRPNIEFLDRRQVQVKAAVLADERMRTTAENLYAAGDVSQAVNRISGRHEWLGTWGAACSQGRTAGWQMAGRAAVYPGTLAENISPFFDWCYAQLGDIQPPGEAVRHVAFGDPERGGYGLLAFCDGTLTGANLINCTRYAGTLRRAILLKCRCPLISQTEDGFPAETAAVNILKDCLEGVRQIPLRARR